MWPILAYKAMLFCGFMTCVVFAYALFRRDEPEPVVDKFTFTKFFVIEKPHSGTVFVAMAMVCFVVMVTTKSEWKLYNDGSVSLDLAADADDEDEPRVYKTLVASAPSPVESIESIEVAPEAERLVAPEPVAVAAHRPAPTRVAATRHEPRRVEEIALIVMDEPMPEPPRPEPEPVATDDDDSADDADGEDSAVNSSQPGSG